MSFFCDQVATSDINIQLKELARHWNYSKFVFFLNLSVFLFLHFDYLTNVYGLVYAYFLKIVSSISHLCSFAYFTFFTRKVYILWQTKSLKPSPSDSRDVIYSHSKHCYLHFWNCHFGPGLPGPWKFKRQNLASSYLKKAITFKNGKGEICYEKKTETFLKFS